MIIVKYHGKGLHLSRAPLIIVKDLQQWKGLYIPHSKYLEGDREEKG